MDYGRRLLHDCERDNCFSLSEPDRVVLHGIQLVFPHRPRLGSVSAMENLNLTLGNAQVCRDLH